jgi:alkanesulfonate monooxygenase SsuD/methylene tetrahydromethanopterin reductase-like flavin-dependent oxidoreductase (luciferase family)
MHLGAFFHPTGHHVASWLHPDAQADAGTNFRHYVQLAQMSEQAKFDLISSPMRWRYATVTWMRSAAGRSTWRISSRSPCCQASPG